MTAKFSINKACLALFMLLAAVQLAAIVFLYLLTGNACVILIELGFALLIFACVALFIAIIRQKLTAFSDALCTQLDDMMSGDIEPPQVAEEESLFYKINHRLSRLYEVMRENRRSIAKERADLQELISDISHQVKTPIANLKMIDATLLTQSMTEQRQKEFLHAMAGQLDKLDFLIQALVKTSRLETGVISLEKKEQPIYDTLAAALGGILLNAEKKNISVSVTCPEKLSAAHDRKWTSEALFNILDNAVKYTPEGGEIRVEVEDWEMYLKIDIADSGKGIPESNHAKIFGRFFREEEVHDAPGIGIGLYLSREIVTLQGGHIKLNSAVGSGSIFSVFLPHK